MGYDKFLYNLWLLNCLLCPIFYDINMENKFKWDKEYNCTFLDEYLFLRKKGIRYTWVYKNEYGQSVWKYKKTHELWAALAEMYLNPKYL